MLLVNSILLVWHNLFYITRLREIEKLWNQLFNTYEWSHKSN